jgi:DNA polymerase III alpha subunit (gram-positive type)
MLQILLNKATEKLGFDDKATRGVIECEIFSVKDEVRKIEENEIYSFSLTDYQTAINCKLFTKTTD